MKVVVSGKEIASSSSLLKMITRSESMSISITKKKKGNVLTLSASKDGSAVRVFNYSADTGDKPGKFTVLNSILKGVFSNRDIVTLSHKKDSNTVKFSASGSKKYRGELTTVDYENIEVSNKSETFITLTEDVNNALSDAISRVSINNIFSDDPMYMLVKMSSKGLQIVCLDEFHIAYYNDKNVKSDDIEFSLPLDTMSILQKLANDTTYKLGVNESAVVASNRFFEATLPIIQSEQDTSFDMVNSLLKKIKKPDSKVKVSKNDFTKVLSAMMNIHEEGAGVVITCSKKGLLIKISTGFGKLEEIIDVESINWKKDAEYTIVPSVVLDSLRVMKGETLELNFIDDWIVYTRDKNSFYSCSLI